ncbi:hypothetical protein ACFLZV_05825 [Candidatus Margulisiibacteriota bacterium]
MSAKKEKNDFLKGLEEIGNRTFLRLQELINKEEEILITNLDPKELDDLSVYCVRLKVSELSLEEIPPNQMSKKYEYDFVRQKLLLNGKKLSTSYFKELVSKIEDVADDLKQNRAFIYQLKSESIENKNKLSENKSDQNINIKKLSPEELSKIIGARQMTISQLDNITVYNKEKSTSEEDSKLFLKKLGEVFSLQIKKKREISKIENKEKLISLLTAFKV